MSAERSIRVAIRTRQKKTLLSTKKSRRRARLPYDSFAGPSRHLPRVLGSRRDREGNLQGRRIPPFLRRREMAVPGRQDQTFSAS